MSSGAARLPGHRGGRCRHAEPSWVASAADAAIRARFGSPSRHRRRRGRPGCPDAGHAVRRSVRVRCPPCGPTSVQLVGRTPGVQATGVQVSGVQRPVSRCPVSIVQMSGVHATGVQTTGVIQVCGQPGVRCPRPLQPRCPHHAGSRASVRRDRPRLWLARASTAAWPPLGRRTGCGAALAAWPTQGAGPAPGAGRLAGEQGRAGAHTSPPACASWAGRRRDGRPWS